MRPYCFVGSLAGELPEGLPKHFDLVTNIEVLEHIYEEDCEKAITTLCKAADTILFSSSSTDLTEATHVNVQQPEYWAKRFAKHGFYHSLDYDASYLSSVAALFRKGKDIVRLVEDYERDRRQRADWMTQLAAGEAHAARVYFDCGDGFSEGKSKKLRLGEDGTVSCRFMLPEGCKTVRFDPVEGIGALVWDLRVRAGSDAGSRFLRVVNHNGVRLGEAYAFRTSDPYILFEQLPDESLWMEIKGELVLLGQSAWTGLVQEIERLDAKVRTAAEEE